MSLPLTPSQTVGPFFHLGLTQLHGNPLAPSGPPRLTLAVEGRVLDGAGAAVNDALLEVWSADPKGHYPAPSGEPGEPQATGEEVFKSFCRLPTDEAGAFRFTTHKPGRVALPDGTPQAPHIVVAIFARGLLKQLITRIYFPDEPSNQTDPWLGLVPAARRATLIARRATGEQNILEWNAVLQGAGETVFFDV